MTASKVWTEEPAVLFRRGEMQKFVPSESMDHNQKLNSVMRFALYSSMLIYAYTEVASIMLLPIVTGFITYALVKSPVGQQMAEQETEQDIPEPRERPCQRPTPENPMMNVMMTDYKDDPDRPPACDTEDSQETQEQQTDYITAGLYSDADKLFDRSLMERQWTTNPSTTIPNDREAFIKFVYGGIQSCKSDPSQCEPVNLK